MILFNLYVPDVYTFGAREIISLHLLAQQHRIAEEIMNTKWILLK